MQNNVKTVALMAFMGALLVLVGGALGGRGGLWFGLILAFVMNMGAYFFSDKLALRSSRAVPIPEGELPEVRQIIAELAAAENMPMPALYYIDSPQPNAFATGRNPSHAAVAVTRGILQIMSYEELRGVLAHELAHVKNRDILIGSIAATMAAALTFATRMSLFRGGNRDNPLGAIVGLLSLILAPIAAMLIRSAISRAREYQADASGAVTTGDPIALASALAKLESGTARHPMQVSEAYSALFIADPLKAFSMQGMGKLFSTHPPIPDRVARLQEMARR